MKALVYEGPRQMNIQETDIPVINDNEVLIKVAYSGICGSELSGFLGHNSLRKPPLIFGHEFSGVVEQIGSAVVSRFSVGQRVTANPLVTCGHCRPCRMGRQQLCLNKKLLSASLPGSNAAYVKVPSASVYGLADHVSLELGAMTEPAACAVRVMELANVSPADTIFIAGMGPIGQLIFQAAKIYGVRNVIVADLNEDRLEMARSMGAIAIHPKETDAVAEVKRLTAGYGTEVAIDAVGAGMTRTTCINCAAPGGTVIFTGLHEAESVMPVNAMVRNETRTIGSFAYSSLNFETALKWISDRTMGLAQAVVKAPLEDGAYWFDRLAGNAGNVSKVLLYPSNN